MAQNGLTISQLPGCATLLPSFAGAATLVDLSPCLGSARQLASADSHERLYSFGELMCMARAFRETDVPAALTCVEDITAAIEEFGISKDGLVHDTSDQADDEEDLQIGIFPALMMTSGVYGMLFLTTTFMILRMCYFPF